MRTHRNRIAIALAAFAMASTSVWAQSDAVPLPPERQSGNVSYVTGGIAYEQLPAFKQARSAYPLNIEFYEKSGAKQEFTADVGVKLFDKGGDVVLDATTDGPYLWAKVRPGQYKLQATLNGRMVERQVAVNNSGTTRAIVVFPQGTDD